MANPQDRPNCQEHQQSKQHECTRDDFAAYASANANYYYQMSLWWWNTYMHNLHARTQPWASQVGDQSCECVERSMMLEDDFECCQNDGDFDSLGGQMNLCKGCPQLCTGPPWQRLQGEYSTSSKKHHDLNFKDNHDLNDDGNDDDICSGSNENCDGHTDDDNGDDDDCRDDDNGDDDDDDGSDVNMEVDDDFRKFLEQSEKHRQEREQRKKEILQEKDDYIEVGSIHLNTTTRAPSEQPGSKRKAEMQTLYGKRASVIMSLEASLQLNYDKHCDLRQPIFWPSIPLKF
ncbi:hypothetical protein ACROYT_G018711 [Oculina patagonica]